MENLDRVIYQVLLSRMKPDIPIKEFISYQTVRDIIDRFVEVVRDEPIMLEIPSDIHIVGDIHGNIDDLLRIFETVGYPPDQKYIFLGDYIDRGKYGFEVMILLFALKCRFPSHIYLLRGNHELEHISSYYGFYAEMQVKYDGVLFYAFHTAFRFLPLAAVIDYRIFCVHGGISPELNDLKDFKKLSKPAEINEPGIFMDLVWSDPREKTEKFEPNTRGCGKFYGSKALQDFLDLNDLDVVIRSHEMCTQGYSFPYSISNGCITVFSNTNYCGRKNKAAIINVSPDLKLDTTQFKPLSDSEKAKRRVTFPDFLLYIIVKEVNEKVELITSATEPNSEVDLVKSSRNAGYLTHEESSLQVLL